MSRKRPAASVAADTDDVGHVAADGARQRTNISTNLQRAVQDGLVPKARRPYALFLQDPATLALGGEEHEGWSEFQKALHNWVTRLRRT